MPLFAIWEVSTNWGDAVNPTLIKMLSGKTPKNVSPYKHDRSWFKNMFNNLVRITENEPVFMAVGSILAWADKHTVVWGAGFISSDERLKEAPLKICAVRGPLSREIVLDQGFSCRPVYGDPALLFSRLYPKKTNLKYVLGIVPHFVDYEDACFKFGNNKDVLVVDVRSGIFNVVNQILECEKVASSCLHGLVIADSYGIPGLWLKFSDRVIGHGFKFRDYYGSLNRWNVEPFVVTEKTCVNDILDSFEPYKIKLDFETLLNSCPFVGFEPSTF